MDNQKVWKALYYSAMRDATDVLQFIPVIGDLLADPIEDMAIREIQKTLSPQELSRYFETSKILPEVASMLITMKVPPPSPLAVEKALREKGWALPPSPIEALRKRGWALP